LGRPTPRDSSSPRKSMIAFDPSFLDSELDHDTECMIRASAGDREAFDELVSRHFPSTVRIISSMMGTTAYSEELAQDVFLRVYRSRERYLPTAKFTTWLGTITRNVVLNAKRSLSRQRIYTAQFSDDHDRPAEGRGMTVSSPSVEVDYVAKIGQREITSIVKNAVAKLPERPRQAMELVHFRGMPYADAAEEMATTRKAVKSLLGRGRLTLKQTLQCDRKAIEACEISPC